MLSFYILRGHSDKELLEVINDPCRNILYHAIMEVYSEEIKKLTNKK